MKTAKLLLALIVLLVPLRAALAQPEPPALIALVNGTLIAGAGAGPVPGAALVIEDGRIAAVGLRDAVDIPLGAQIIDVGGAAILPGFINAHVHNAYRPANLLAWAQAGVTTVRDMRAFMSDEWVNAGVPYLFSRLVVFQPQYARVVSTGPMLTAPGGYGSLGLASPEDARATVNRLIDRGARVIKVAIESGRMLPQPFPVLAPEEAAAIVAAAHARGIKVSIHVTASEDLARALDAGADDIAHMVVDNLPDDLIARAVEHGVYWTPTLELWHGVSEMYHNRYEPLAVENLRRFVEAGGQVALGTDYDGYYFEFELGMPMTEITLMQEAGMTPMQIIVAGTRNAAHVCNLDDEIGTLEVGKAADVLVVDGDPLQDIHALVNVRLVIHRGQVIRDANK
ncbi:MAG: amidohydrolase family protein [Anaerolineae bacterium]|nr:amidohydrolase family protein [Anaerolineae bacterium]